MRIHYIIHASFEKLGMIESWIEKNQFQASGTHTYKGEKLPDVSAFDLLILMGGPQSVRKLDQYPYLRDEIALAKNAIQQGKAVLGICLGAQLVGEALGARAEQSPCREVGIYPVHATQEAAADPFFKQLPKAFDVIHWHNDMPGLPKGSVLLASSAGCPRQAFRYGDRVYGLQFHLEITPELMRDMIEHCRDDLKPSDYVQTAEQLVNQDVTAINQKMEKILDYLASCIAKTKVKST
ncbi:glutamine amidotransferase-related protein [Aquicella lusitana]|uniref:GMP synthase (Glutamine-hydrolysing) n=1 Tax=Aquicella lusitana TaxID=254246 RepID=A0A370GH14_9COXI|nr:gamma-glutamyl-gamma-aminobutyrate hydrolase family protein [Aquicella lusitana]RDI42536.1 GMP synthase (glutamine-hydrolysing) [Aquicella lusitana]VVC74315.1 GMP synthase [glutamine-hydrolyzing] [Aquicella lusitana]